MLVNFGFAVTRSERRRLAAADVTMRSRWWSGNHGFCLRAIFGKALPELLVVANSLRLFARVLTDTWRMVETILPKLALFHDAT